MKIASQIALALATLAAVVGGVVLLVRLSPSDGGMEIVLPVDTPAPAPQTALKAYVSGAVRNPDVYEFEEGDRLEDIIESAGGLTEDADRDAINPSVRLKDEDHWHIPKIGEGVSGATSAAQRSGGPEKIDINSADVETLMSLHGIGEAKAKAIVSYRETNGPFSSVEELIEVNGIGPDTLNGFRDQVEAR